MLLLTQLFLLPFYVNILGVESYALIGIYIALQAVFVMFDLGMSTTVNQALADMLADDQKKDKSNNLLWTFELIYWILGLIIFVVVYFLLPVITDQWIGQSGYDVEDLRSQVLFIALLVVVRFPLSFYTGAMNGLQLQYKMNFILIVFELVKFASIILFVLYVSKSVSIYFLVNIFLSLVSILILRSAIYRSIGNSTRPVFDKSVIREHWRFSLGVCFISLAAILASQSDKFVLGKMVSMTEFSFYTLAFTIASIPSKIYSSVASAFYPALVTEKSKNQLDSMINVYHKACQMISILTVPVVMMVIAFMPQLLELWFGNNEKAEILTPLVRVLLIGFTLNGFVTMPYYIQLVHKWTRLSIVKNLIALIVLLPALYYAIQYFGIMGACWIWSFLNAMYFAFEVPIMHTRILKDEQFKYYIQDIGLILVCGMVCSLGLYLFVQYVDMPIYVLMLMFVVFIPAQIVLLNWISTEKPLNSFLKYFKLST